MKEVFLILYHESSEKSVDYLRDLIKEIDSRNKKFIISSHSAVPNDIILRSSGFIYDPENLLTELEPKMLYWIEVGNKKIYSPYLGYGSISHKSYGIAAFKNVLNGICLANQLGYELLHVMDYDFLPDLEELENNKNTLLSDEINFIAYKTESSEMLGCFSVKLEKTINFNLSNTDLHSLFSSFDYFTEKALFNLVKSWFGENKTLCKGKEIQNHGRFTSFMNPSHLESLIYQCPSDYRLKLFLNNSDSETKEITVYGMRETKEDIFLGPYSWFIKDLGEKHEIKFIDIYMNGILSRKWDISDEEKFNKYVSVNKIEIQN
jgi:hypothetical protein